MQKDWAVRLDDTTHHIVFDKSRWSNKRTIAVDGVTLSPQEIRKEGVYGFNGKDVFAIGTHRAALHWRSNGLSTKYDLEVDGYWTESGRPVLPMPGWAWVFVGACLLIPL